MILGDDGTPQRLWVRTFGRRLKIAVPAITVKQRCRVQDVVPEASRLAGRGLVTDENPIQLLFNPDRRTVHAVDLAPTSAVDPLVAWLPELVADLAAGGESGGYGAPVRHGDRCSRVNIEIEIRLLVGGAGNLGAGQRYRVHLGNIGECSY